MEPSENKGFNGRKLIQVSANSFGVVGLADDGTVWAIGANRDTQQWGVWERLPDFPRTDDDATKQETVRGSEKRTFFGLPLPHIALIRQMDKGQR